MKYVVTIPAGDMEPWGDVEYVRSSILGMLRTTFAVNATVTAVEPGSDLDAGLDGAAVTL